MTPDQERECAERAVLRLERIRAERAAKWAAVTPEQLLRMRIEESAHALDPVTTSFLGLAVTLWIEEMRRWSPERREHRAHELADVIAFEQSSAALADPEARGTSKGGALGKAFNAIAQGLACLAYCPGGIVFAGHYWEAKP